MLLAALALLGAARADQDHGKIETSTNKPAELVDKIRRQLMEDNYDYLPSEDELITPSHDPPGPHASRDPHDDKTQENDRHDTYADNDNADKQTNAKDIDTDVKGDDTQDEPKYRIGDREGEGNEDNGLMSDARADFFPRARDSTENFKTTNGEEVSKGHVVAKKDLLYYVDDERLRAPGAGAEDFDDVAEDTASTAKYKVLKVKNSRPHRRSGSARRLIQEQSRGGVALIRLDELPFPQFRLPRARRQYMRDRSGLSREN